MKKYLWHKITGNCKMVLFAFFLFGCTQDPILWQVKSEEQVIYEYITSKPEYSEFAKLVEASGLDGLLSVRGPFTLFLPSDSVMQKYYTKMGVTSYTDLDPRFIKNLVYNHLIISDVPTSDIGLGAIKDTNALGDYLVTEFVNGDDILINKQSLITKRDIPAANGRIHLIDKVIDPVTISVYDLVASNPSFSLFAQGLERTRLRDTLQTISFPYGNKMARNRFTVLAVPDAVFNRDTIYTIDELIAKFTDDPNSITSLNNGFYRFMEYHCLGGAYFLNNFTSRLYPILSNDNNISVVIDTAYKLNFDKVTKKYTSFIIDQSNFPAKNGTMHTINDILPVMEPEPGVVTFETTDYFDMRQGDYFGKYYMRWHDGQNTFAKIKWAGDYMLYYFKDHDTGTLLNDDCLSMSGWWWVEITTPKIMKGKYKITSNLWSGQISYSVYVDGINTAIIKYADPAFTTSWGEFNWTTTEEHKIKVINLSSGLLFWDTVIFTPIN